MALHLTSGIDYIVHCYAVWRCGGCVVPVPVELTAGEKAEICHEIAVDSLLTADPTDFFDALRAERHIELDSARLIPLAPRREHPAGFGTLNAAFIRFTSGTTGSSKGVVLSHETIHQRIQAANDALRIGPSDRIVWVLSMSYHFTVSIVAYLTFGATIVLPRNHLADGLIDAASHARATLLYAAPAHYMLLAAAPDVERLSALRLAISTAMSLDTDVAVEFQRRSGTPVSQALGIIEVGLPAINLDFAADRPDGLGRPLPAYDLRIDDVGLDAGLGEIVIAGPGILDAYYEPWQTRDDILSDGWFHTGDVGAFDTDGCLFIHGRSKDVINVAGMKFFPQEVENVLQSHPGVREACVFARSHPQFGELPYARIVPERPSTPPTAAELDELCRRRLTEFKRPQGFEFVSRLERTASGKPLRREKPIAARPAEVR